MAQLTQQILVTGRVQGVGFRRFAQTCALAGGLKGWVRNLADGRVEVLVQGEESSLHSFVEKLKQGPSLSQVQRVSVDEVKSDSAFTEFTVIKDGEKPWRES